MSKDICNFEALAGQDLLEALENEFQYQMELTDGEYVFWLNTEFEGCMLEPAIDAKSQAVLQFFANCACPFSTLRLARSMSRRNAEHGPIVSDDAAVYYLLAGAEQLTNNLHDPKVKDGLTLYLESKEFRLACELFAAYRKDFKGRTLCPEVQELMTKSFLEVSNVVH